MSITLERSRLNLWNLGGFVIAIAVAAFGWGITYSSLTSANEKAAIKINSLSEEVKDIRAELPKLQSVQFQVTRTTEQLAESKAVLTSTNDRIDRVVESFGNKLDTISTNVNRIATRVEVLSTQVSPNGSVYRKDQSK